MCVEGTMDVHYGEHSESLRAGETILIPAAIDSLELVGDKAVLLDVCIPKDQKNSTFA